MSYGPLSPGVVWELASKCNDDRDHKLLRFLTESYASRALDFSDTVACLGQYIFFEQKIPELLAEIQRKRHLCEAAEENLVQHLEKMRNGSCK